MSSIGGKYEAVWDWLYVFVLAFSCFWVAVPVLSVTALVIIAKSHGRVRGKEFAVVGLVIWLSIVFYYLGGFFPHRPHKMPPKIVCGTNLKGLGTAMCIYAGEDESGRFPAPDRWCDLLIQGDYASERQFLCPSSDAVWGESGYAINKNVADKGVNLPPDVVLLFETNFGTDPNGRQALLKDRRCFPSLRYGDPETRVHRLRWNQLGGPEILTTENHKGKGCNILFVDGRVEFVKTQNLGNLKWK
jgi:prepilin-type processing-associated H-X9-DG protein